MSLLSIITVNGNGSSFSGLILGFWIIYFYQTGLVNYNFLLVLITLAGLAITLLIEFYWYQLYNKVK